MKRRVGCLLLGLSILCLPVQQVYAAPAGPVAQEEEHKKPVLPHEKKNEELVPPHEREHEHPVPPHEHKKPHEVKLPHELKKPSEEKGLLAEKPVPPVEAEKPVPPHENENQNTELPVVTATPTAKPTVAPTATPTAKPTVAPTTTPTAKPTVAPTATPTPVPTTAPSKEETTDNSAMSDLRKDVVEYALQFVGNPYKYGGTSLTNGTDCSGFTQAIYAKFGYSLERSSKGQAADTEFKQVSVKESELLPGDLIFYAENGSVYHVAMYIGDGKIVHAANAKKGIVVADFSYYNMKPYIARRIIE